jgi:hypothetical protein
MYSRKKYINRLTCCSLERDSYLHTFMDTSSCNLTSSCDSIFFSSDSECDEWNTQEEVPDLPPSNGSYIINEYGQYLDGLGVEEKGERLIEMAMSYCYKSTLFGFVWGVREDIHGDFSPELQAMVNDFNQLEREDGDECGSYFGFSRCMGTIYAFYTPVEDDGSISIEVSEEDAKQLSECFAHMNYTDINHLL